MRFTMNRDALSHAMQVAGRVASRGTTPAMACVLIEAGEEGCSFSATDGDQHVRHSDMAMVDEPGKCLVSAKALGKAVKSMADGAVTVEAANGQVSVECGKRRFTIPSLDPREFFGSLAPVDGPSVEVDAAVLQVMCKRVSPFCAPDKESREFMKGVHLVSNGGMLRMEATDSYRVAACEQPVEGGDLDCLVPRAFLLSAADSMHGEVSIASDGNRVRLSCESTEMAARCISHRFPDLSKHVARRDASATVERDRLLGALNGASQLGDGRFGMSIDAAGGSMDVYAGVDSVGSFSDSVPCDGELSVFANSQFLRSCVEAMDCEEVGIAVRGPRDPVLFMGGSVVALTFPMVRGAE